MKRSTREEKPRILDACTGCGYCFLVCPQKAVQVAAGSGYQIDAGLCSACGKCIYACPVDAISAVQEMIINPEPPEPDLAGQDHYDAVVIGSGIGGLLSAAALARRGKRTLVVERLNFIGGRFTHFNFEGASISTGACHAVPFGTKGPFADMVNSLELPVKIIDHQGMGSLFISGKQHPWKGIWDFMGPFSLRSKFDLLKIIPKVLFSGSSSRPGLSFGRWLDRQTSSGEVRSFFERMFNFGCSLCLDELDFDEAVKIIKNVYRSRAPGVIEGGCGYLVQKLVELVQNLGGTILIETEAVAVAARNGRVCGVKVKNRNSGSLAAVATGLVVSDIGPHETFNLLQEEQEPGGLEKSLSGTVGEFACSISPLPGPNPGPGDDSFCHNGTGGICINMVCDTALLEHASIIYCLDTQRVAGLAQPSGLEPALAPEGKHLLLAYQLIESNDLNREVELGLQDLRNLFGDRFTKNCRVINTGVFKNRWPVNRAAQGKDHLSFPAVKGLYLVGDGCKAPGCVMVEGIAARVKEVLNRID